MAQVMQPDSRQTMLEDQSIEVVADMVGSLCGAVLPGEHQTGVLEGFAPGQHVCGLRGFHPRQKLNGPGIERNRSGTRARLWVPKLQHLAMWWLCHLVWLAVC